MGYVKRQLKRELCRDRGFLLLLLGLSAFPSFMYFFVHVSVDGNLRWLDGLASLTENQVLYRNGLVSNGILAGNVLLAFGGLAGFGFALYFYRFFRANQVEFGCLKALGFMDRELGRYIVLLAVCLALAGAVIGLAGGYFASDILIRAGEESYQVNGLVKGLNPGSFLAGILVPPAVAGTAVLGTYGMIRGRETGILMAETKEGESMKRTLRLADTAAAFVPGKYRRQVRLALRKPVTVLLILGASASFSIMFILAYSLTLSSGVIFKSQTEGHNYRYNTTFEMPVLDEEREKGGKSLADVENADVEAGEVRYLAVPGNVTISGNEISQNVIGMEGSSPMFELLDNDKKILPAPSGDEIVIGAALHEMYGVNPGDTVVVSFPGSESPLAREMKMTVVSIAFNAAADSIYMEKRTLAAILSLPPDAYTGIWSMNPPAADIDAHEGLHPVIQSHEEKLELLRRDSVSNRSSAVINQVMGCFIGCTLLYLALLLNFQDSAKEIQILRLIGYEPGEIRRMLLDIYRPLLWLSFFLTLWPGILTVKAILKSLSLQIGDYLPFRTNVLVILGIFLLQNLVYWLVQRSFRRAICRVEPLNDAAKY